MEFLSSPALWFSLVALLVIVEVFTGAMIAACLAAGCLVSGVLALMGCGPTVLVVGLIAGTLAAFVCIVPLVRHFRGPGGREATNVSGMDALIGREACVTEPIGPDGTGRVRIDGDSWQARALAGQRADKGDKVRVTGYESIVLTVETL